MRAARPTAGLCFPPPTHAHAPTRRAGLTYLHAAPASINLRAGVSPLSAAEPWIIEALGAARTKLFDAAGRLDESTSTAARFEEPPTSPLMRPLPGGEITRGRTGATLRAIASGAEDLGSIEAQVDASVLAPPIKRQVTWNLRQMRSDVDKLRVVTDPVRRAALSKALELRFSVLLSKAFWERPVDRGLLS